MKQLFILATAFLASIALAEGKFTWTMEVDHKDGQYKSGETVTFTVTAKLDGKPVPAGTKFDCSWNCGREKGEKFELVMEGEALEVKRVVTEPCYYTLTMKPLDANGKLMTKEWLVPSGTVLCDLEKIKMPEGTMPEDFDAWWDAEVAAQKKIPMEVDRKVRGLYDGADENRKKVIDSRAWMKHNYSVCNCYDVRIKAAGENWTAGGLVIPKKPGKYPAIINFYGVGWDGVCHIDTLSAVNNNAIVFHVNAHGLPQGASWETDYPAMKKKIEAYAATKPEWQKMYPKIGMGEGREKGYYRYVFLRAARAVEYIKTLPEWDGKTIIVNGRSQGSAQAIAAAALEPGVSHMMLGISAMADFSGNLAKPKRRCGWPYNVRNDAIYPEAGYYDTVNFVHRLHGKQINMCFGMTDYLVQPCGPACIYNAIPADNEKTLVTEAMRGHDSPWCMSILDPKISKVCKESNR